MNDSPVHSDNCTLVVSPRFRNGIRSHTSQLHPTRDRLYQEPLPRGLVTTCPLRSDGRTDWVLAGLLRQSHMAGFAEVSPRLAASPRHHARFFRSPSRSRRAYTRLLL